MATTDSCFTLIAGAHQRGKAIGLMNGKTHVSKTPYCPSECKAVYQAPAPHNTCGSCWLGTAPQFSHEMCGEDGSWVWCMCAPNFNLSFENSDLNCSLHKEFEISTLHSKFFEILKFVFLSEVAHKSFWVKFSGLISKLKILEKSY